MGVACLHNIKVFQTGCDCRSVLEVLLYQNAGSDQNRPEETQSKTNVREEVIQREMKNEDCTQYLFLLFVFGLLSKHHLRPLLCFFAWRTALRFVFAKANPYI